MCVVKTFSMMKSRREKDLGIWTKKRTKRGSAEEKKARNFGGTGEGGPGEGGVRVREVRRRGQGEGGPGEGSGAGGSGAGRGREVH